MSTHHLRRYLDLVNEADLVPPNTNVALPSSGTFTNDQAIAAAFAQQDRCVKCGTALAEHAGLQHAFAAGTTVPSGGGGIARIRQLQQELKTAGAALGATGAGRDGVDGDLGPLTRAAVAKYPAIAARYSDVVGAQAATAAATPANITQLTTALDTIEKILTKYKVKMSEHWTATKSNQMATWRDLIEHQAIQEAKRKAKRTAAQRAAYISSIGTDADNRATAAETPEQRRLRLQKIAQLQLDKTAKPVSAGARTIAGSTGKGVAGAVAKTLGRAVPGVGLALGASDAYDRAKQGDYTGAAISGAAGLASLVPGVGTAAAVGLTGVNLARDYATNPTINISSEDAVTLDQNLKTLQDLGRDPAVAAAITPELRTRLERVIKAAAAATVANTQAGSQAATTAPGTAAPADLVQSVDGIERILTKYKFESETFQHHNNAISEHLMAPKSTAQLSAAEQMAVHRDLMSEAGVAATALKYGGKALKYGLGAAGLYGAYTVGRLSQMSTELNNSLDQLTIAGPANGLSDLDRAQLEQHAAVLEKYLKTSDDAAQLPPEMQQRLAAINARMKNLVAAGADR